MNTKVAHQFPPEGPLETPDVLRALARAHRYLGELTGTAKMIPNENLLVSAWTG